MVHVPLVPGGSHPLCGKRLRLMTASIRDAVGGHPERQDQVPQVGCRSVVGHTCSVSDHLSRGSAATQQPVRLLIPPCNSRYLPRCESVVSTSEGVVSTLQYGLSNLLLRVSSNSICQRGQSVFGIITTCSCRGQASVVLCTHARRIRGRINLQGFSAQMFLFSKSDELLSFCHRGHTPVNAFHLVLCMQAQCVQGATVSPEKCTLCCSIPSRYVQAAM